jgi:hypothetical protein
MLKNEAEVFSEKHYTPKELAKCWGVSPDWIRRRFANEPGVLHLKRPKPGTRRYDPIRIPASVAARVYAELSLRTSPRKRELTPLTIA